MKKKCYLILLGALITLSCNGLEKTTRNSVIVDYKCIFQGNADDIRNFLGKDSIVSNDIGLQLFANHYLFFEGEEETLMMYIYDKKNKIFETFKSKDLSTKFKNDRKYKMHLTDSTSEGFKMKIESSDKLFTQIKDGSIIIECIKKVGNVPN